MRRAVDALAAQSPGLALDFLLLDQIKWRGFPGREIEYQAVIRGDSLSLSIAAASVLAKVARDAWMVDYDAQYPGYGFAIHKGYGVKAHQAALRELGASPLHRMSWRPFQQPRLPFEDAE
jgi:ribonuclease HII